MTVSLPRFALRAAIVLGAVCTLGIWPVYRWESTQGVVAWTVAFAVVFVGAVLGAIPLATGFARERPENLPFAWMIGFGIRMLLVLSACLVVSLTRPFPANPFLLGAGVGYAVTLVIEVATASRMMRPDEAALGASHHVGDRHVAGDGHATGDLVR